MFCLGSNGKGSTPSSPPVPYRKRYINVDSVRNEDVCLPLVRPNICFQEKGNRNLLLNPILHSLESSCSILFYSIKSNTSYSIRKLLDLILFYSILIPFYSILFCPVYHTYLEKYRALKTSSEIVPPFPLFAYYSQSQESRIILKNQGNDD